ncbi:GNAT family N-acetyltransferase, partial [Lactococcus cremoris]
ASKNETYIELIAVSKEFRKQGIGKELINYIKYHNLNKVITLFVSEDNKNALRLYKKQAFTVKRKIKSKFVKKIIGIKGFYFMSY